MAVERIAQIDRYQGASGDTKPASPADGSIFYETDTAKTFVFAGGSWVEASELVKLAAALPAGTNNIGDVDVLSIAAGANIIGKVGIDQTTPGTTNGVQLTGSITVTHAAVNAAVTTGAALAAAAGRKFACFINDSDTAIYLNIGGNAVLNTGIRLNPYGGSYTMSPGFGNLSTAAVNCIHGGSGNKVLLVISG